jgi:hypothetical protein
VYWEGGRGDPSAMVPVTSDTQHGKSVATKIAARQAGSAAARPDAVSVECGSVLVLATATGHVRPGDNPPPPELAGGDAHGSRCIRSTKNLADIAQVLLLDGQAVTRYKDILSCMQSKGSGCTSPLQEGAIW